MTKICVLYMYISYEYISIEKIQSTTQTDCQHVT